MIKNDHISFSSGFDVYQICRPILRAFKFQHFTFCRIFPDGSRAILTTTPESLYDLYKNKEYLFRDRSKQSDFDLSDFESHKKIQYNFHSEQVDAIPEKFKNVRETYLKQIQYEKERQNISDRFTISIRYKKYYESFIFFIPVGVCQKNIYLNNLEILNHFRAFFLDKGNQLIAKAEKDKILKPFNRTNRTVEIAQIADINQIIHEMNPDRYYIADSNTYLTKRQMICAAYLMHSYRAKQIAKITNLSNRTVEDYITEIRRKFNCKERHQLIEKLVSTFPGYRILLSQEL